MDNPLNSARVELLDRCLVVEDDSIIRIDLEATLRGFGLRHVHAAPTVEAAQSIIANSDIRFAVLDYSVGSANTVAMAEALAARGVPALFLTAYGTSVELPPSLSHFQVLSKPFSSDLLAAAMLKELDGMAAEAEPVCEGHGCD